MDRTFYIQANTSSEKESWIGAIGKKEYMKYDLTVFKERQW